MENGPEIKHRAIVADKAMTAMPIMRLRERPGLSPPSLTNQTGATFPPTSGKLNRFKRVALRCEKTAGNFRSIVAMAADRSMVDTDYQTLVDTMPSIYPAVVIPVIRGKNDWNVRVQFVYETVAYVNRRR
ncbi:MAG: hypothetical protein MnENMB40S_24890 [Rhizobiaceae bacterium MnEN-MB40S]|nr:MAG: hypothetical protein MnENMB40S_24890 [Rhizobiaceae bacterium MnEN-MB40S]